jgi:hypothetical protein
MRPPTTPRHPAWPRRPAVLWAWLALGTIGAGPAQAIGQEAAPRKPATVAEAAKVLDLETFPLLDGAENPGRRRMASLFYQAKGEVKTAYEFQKRALVAKGLKELPGSNLSDDSAYGMFGRDGFVVSVSTFPVDPQKPGNVRVMINQHGNVDLAKLPVPPDAKPLSIFGAVAIYVTEARRDDAAKVCRDLLVAEGWQPYGTAGDSLIFKQNAVRLNAMISTAPAQGGKTAIHYSAELLSADLPAPPDPVRAHYADSTKDLSFDVKSSPEALVAFYRDTLAKAGWKATTERTIKDRKKEMLIFRNPGRDMLTLEFSPFAGLLRGTLRHLSAAESDELDRLADEAAARAKAAARPKPKPTVTLPLPAGARDIKEQDGDIAFTVAAGQARAAVEALRASLRQAGWKEVVASLEQVAGVVSLSKKDSGRLTIDYIDTGLMPAEVKITGFGVVIRRADAGRK